MKIRLLPMSHEDLSMKGKTIDEIQKMFFIKYLKEEKGVYKFKSALNADYGDLILFQIDSNIIASSILDSVIKYNSVDSEGYKGEYTFISDSIRIFDPIDSNEFKTYANNFDGFNRVSQYVDIINFKEFEERTKIYTANEIELEKDISVNNKRVQTKDDWIKVLENEEQLNKGKIIPILKFIYMSKDHTTSCSLIANHLAMDIVVINSMVSSFGKRVLDLLLLPEIKGTTNQNRRWNIPFMTNFEKNTKNTFTWELRPELVDAIEEKYDWKEKYILEHFGLKLERFKRYSRKDIHDIFSPNTKFYVGAGGWGISGIMPVPNTESDYVFIVTLELSGTSNEFIEGISDNGVLSWNSQKSQKLNDPLILKFINHDYNKSNIYLFLRKYKNIDYSYLGKLAYVDHDPNHECPVYFKWQILDWDSDYGNITLDKSYENNNEVKEEINSKKEEIDLDNIDSKEFVLTLKNDNLNYVKSKNKTVIKSDITNKNVKFSEDAEKNTKLGNKGEDVVVDYEKKYLISKGRQDLADQVMATRNFAGNAEKYDVLSYEEDGSKKYIEVKTTTGSLNTRFYISENEVLFSEQFKNNYYLYRLYNFDKKNRTADFKIIKGSLNRDALTPTKYDCSIGELL